MRACSDWGGSAGEEWAGQLEGLPGKLGRLAGIKGTSQEKQYYVD